VPRKIIRPKEAQKRLGIGHDKFYSDLIANGKLKLVRLGPRCVGVIEDELDAFIDSLAAEREAV
jgi:excisionase family DNA binding protein